MEIWVHYTKLTDLIESLMHLGGVILKFKPHLAEKEYLRVKLTRAQAKQLRREISDHDVEARFQEEVGHE